VVIPSVCTGSTGCTASTSTAGRSTVKVVSATALTLRVTLTSIPASGFETTRICGPLKTRFRGGVHIMEDPRRGGSIKHSCQATV